MQEKEWHKKKKIRREITARVNSSKDMSQQHIRAEKETP